MNDAQILSAALEFLRRGWCQGYGALDKAGNACPTLSDDVVKLCALAAVARAFRDAGAACGDMLRLIRETISPFVNRNFPLKDAMALSEYNDSHSYEEVIELFERALANVRA